MEECSENAFKESFKYYKVKWPLPNLSDVIDLDNPEEQRVHEFQIEQELPSLPLGLQPLHAWRCFQLPAHPGLCVLRNPFTTRGERYWMARCLRDFPQHPNEVNLNARLFSAEVIKDWWSALQQCENNDECRRLKISMRWATLGYHHDWNTKVYSEKKRSDFPADLHKLCAFFAQVLGFTEFSAQAAIVNYYPIGTTLAGHTDHSEQNLAAPLFSLSFGQTAIFLIGGSTKEVRPTAIYLRSGDVLVMSKESRLCYHAVPRIMKATAEHWNTYLPKADGNNENQRKKLRLEAKSVPNEWAMNTLLYEQVADELHWTPFKQYMHDTRINVNVRQVLLNEQTQLS